MTPTPAGTIGHGAPSYDGRTLRLVTGSDGGDVGHGTVFHYHQRGKIVWATYEGGAVRFGTIVGLVDDKGNLEFTYQHVSADGFKSGRCHSRYEQLDDGRLRLHEQWAWTGGASGQGTSIVEEIPDPRTTALTPPDGTVAR